MAFGRRGCVLRVGEDGDWEPSHALGMDLGVEGDLLGLRAAASE